MDVPCQISGKKRTLKSIQDYMCMCIKWEYWMFERENRNRNQNRNWSRYSYEDK